MLVVGMAYLLVGPFGILGAGLAVLAAPVFMYISTMIFLNRSFGIRMPGRVVACSGWLLVCVLTTGFTGAWLHGFTWQVLLIKSGIYCVAASGFMLLLTAVERQQIFIKIAQWKARWT
jgi:hypothetical protein